jgi:hypothetical protein
LIETFDGQVSDNCRRGLVTMTINKRSRLAEVDGCTKGYYRVSPFMKEAKYITLTSFNPSSFYLFTFSYSIGFADGLKLFPLSSGTWKINSRKM